MKEAADDKKVELKKSGTKIPDKNIDVLRLINTSDLYGLIHDTINKFNDRYTVQEFINDMVGNTDAPTVVKSIDKATTASIFEKAQPIVVQENNHGNTKLANPGFKFNNTFGAHIVEEKEG